MHNFVYSLNKKRMLELQEMGMNYGKYFSCGHVSATLSQTLNVYDNDAEITSYKIFINNFTTKFFGY